MRSLVYGMQDRLSIQVHDIHAHSLVKPNVFGTHRDTKYIWIVLDYPIGLTAELQIL